MLPKILQNQNIPSELHISKYFESPGYDSKQSESKVPVMLKLWGMRSTHSLPSLPYPLSPGLIAPCRVLFKGQIELNC